MNNPVGVFDSGVGGLSVAREIRRRLPAESILYFADTAYCPYGGRPLLEIRDRSLAIGGELLRRGAKVIVVACN
nr:aspartate/glutamate racemase family protein [Gemmatimonadota bacterium]